MKKYILTILITIIITIIATQFISGMLQTPSEKEIKNLTHECLQYIDSKTECTNLAITQVSAEIQETSTKNTK